MCAWLTRVRPALDLGRPIRCKGEASTISDATPRNSNELTHHSQIYCARCLAAEADRRQRRLIITSPGGDRQPLVRGDDVLFTVREKGRNIRPFCIQAIPPTKDLVFGHSCEA